MKVKVFLITALAALGCLAAQIPPPYEVATWKDFKSAAISYTFDDGCTNQFQIAIPAFDQYGFKLTLFPVINWNPNWSKLKAAADSGHEVASHTVSHANLSGLSAGEQTTELENSRKSIESNINGYKCLTTAYPYCAKGTDNITSKYYIAARGCQGFIEGSTPGSYMNVSSIVCGDLGSVKTLADFTSRFQTTLNQKGWCTFLIHGIDGDGGYSPLSSDTLKASLQYLDQNRDKFWVTSFMNAARYAKERDCLTIEEISSSDSLITLQVRDTLPDSLYDAPVTLRRPLPAGWTTVRVEQDNQSCSATIVEVNAQQFVVFDAVPDGGTVRIVNEALASVNNASIKNSMGDYKVKLTRSILSLSGPAFAKGKLFAVVYNLKGSLVWTGEISAVDGTMAVKLPRALSGGMYTVMLSSGEQILRENLLVY